MANLGNTIVNGLLKVNGTIKASEIEGNAASATQTEKMKYIVANPATKTIYHLPFLSDDGSGYRALGINDGFKINTYEGKSGGTEADIGHATLELGNNIANGAVGNKQGAVDLYTTGAGKIALVGTQTNNDYKVFLPAANGTLALTSSNVASATKLQTARTIALTGAVTGSGTFDGSGNLSITTSQNLADGIISINKTLTVGTTWMDTGILLNPDAFPTGSGSYMVQISGLEGNATRMYGEIFTGVMSVYTGHTNSTDSDEIVLHKGGHAPNDRTLYLRTIRQSGGTNFTKLQISSNTTLSENTYHFKFKRLL